MRKMTGILLSSIFILSLSGCGSAEMQTSQMQDDTEVKTAVQMTTTAVTSKGTDETATSEKTTVYDTSMQYDPLVLQDGDMIVGGTYTATGTDESVFEASGNTRASVTGTSIMKASGDASSADDSSFKGVNSGVRVYGNAEVTLKDCTIESDAENATGVFAYENGVVHIADCTVNVTGGGAGGVQVAGGGTLYGSNLTVTTASKAAIRSDRGGGTMVIDGGSYTSNGSGGCPVIYSTANITAKNIVGVSTKSRAVIIEGKNSVVLENSSLTGNDQSTKSGSIRANVLLYQSASGDAKEGTSVFTMTKGKLISESGAMFYCTNTGSIINLRGVELILPDEGELLIVSAGRWGKDGKDGGNCTVNAEDQILEGRIVVDNISSLTLNLTNSSYAGAIANDGVVNVTLDENSTWKLTGDSYVTEFNGDTSNVIFNGYKLFVNGVELTETK